MKYRWPRLSVVRKWQRTKNLVIAQRVCIHIFTRPSRRRFSRDPNLWVLKREYRLPPNVDHPEFYQAPGLSRGKNNGPTRDRGRRLLPYLMIGGLRAALLIPRT